MLYIFFALLSISFIVIPLAEGETDGLTSPVTVLDLIDRISKLEDALQSEKLEKAIMQEKLKFLETKLDKQENSRKTKRQLNTATVAFTAVITPTDLTHLSPGQPIVFDRTITNMGNAYDSSTGIFTAPIRGVYIFSMDAMVEPGENEYLEFVKDGAHVMYNYSHAGGSLHDVSSSRTVVLELEKGNQVWIRTSPNAAHGSGTLHGNEFSTFSGWLHAINE